MPESLRASNKFRTNWMMPPLVAFGGQIDGEQDAIPLEAEPVKRLIDLLFANGDQRATLPVTNPGNIWARIRSRSLPRLRQGVQ
jgi:hypothetical protein